jgi:type I restriction enzyme S subunit
VNVRWFDFDLSDLNFMPFEDRELEEFRLRPGDVLICEGGEAGRAAVWDGREDDIYFQKALHRVRLHEDVVPQYFVYYLRAAADSGRLTSFSTGATFKHLTGQSLAMLPIPIPPLEEQRRIVTRIEELMSLCDQLEQAHKECELQRDALRSVSLHRLTWTESGADHAKDARFFLNRSSRLITRPEHVETFRNTLLDLAVCGRLVAQDGEEGDGHALLTKIARSRRQAGSRKPVGVLEVEVPLPSLPSNWTWAAVDEVSSVESNAITDGPFGANLKTAHYIATPGFRVVRLENIGHGVFRADLSTFITQEHWERLAKHHVFAGDLVVAGLVDPSVRACEIPANIGPSVVKADCYRFHVHPEFSTRFALYYLNSPLCQEFASVHHHGMTLTRLGLGNFRRLPIPVPPLAEQHRIVVKVDELMAMCDRLEAELASAQHERGRFLESLLHEALDQPDDTTRAVIIEASDDDDVLSNV